MLTTYSFPPPGLLHRIKMEGILVIPIAPNWSRKMWYSGSLRLLAECLWVLLVCPDFLSQVLVHHLASQSHGFEAQVPRDSSLSDLVIPMLLKSRISTSPPQVYLKGYFSQREAGQFHFCRTDLFFLPFGLHQWLLLSAHGPLTSPSLVSLTWLQGVTHLAPFAFPCDIEIWNRSSQSIRSCLFTLSARFLCLHL